MALAQITDTSTVEDELDLRLSLSSDALALGGGVTSPGSEAHATTLFEAPKGDKKFGARAHEWRLVDVLLACSGEKFRDAEHVYLTTCFLQEELSAKLCGSLDDAVYFANASVTEVRRSARIVDGAAVVLKDRTESDRQLDEHRRAGVRTRIVRFELPLPEGVLPCAS